jgi:nicotinamidase-related amidase
MTTALLVIDMQNRVVSNAVRRTSVIAAIASLIDRARDADAPVVWIQHSSDELVRDTDDWQLVPELVPRPAEPVIHKQHGDSFEATNLAEVLTGLGARTLVVTGAQSDACVRSTLYGAFVRGYDVTLASDAHTTEDLTEWGAPPPEQVIDHLNLSWQFVSAPNRSAAVKRADGVVFR